MLLYNTIDAFRIYLNEPRSVDHWFKKYEWELMLIAAARLREEREAIKLELKRKAKAMQKRLRSWPTRELCHLYDKMQKSPAKRNEMSPMSTEQVYELLMGRKLPRSFRDKFRKTEKTKERKKINREKSCHRARGRR